MANPNWSRDELILALDVYFREPAARGCFPPRQALGPHHSLVEDKWEADIKVDIAVRGGRQPRGMHLKWRSESR